VPHALRTVAIDGLRGVALLCVLASHAGAPLFGGHVLMFVLSGYLVTTMLLKEQATTHTIRTHAFYAHRARRLLPALIAMLIGVHCVAWLIGADTSHLFAHLWSLAVQEQVYVVWPAIVGASLAHSRGRLLAVCLILAVCSSLLRVGMVLEGVPLRIVYTHLLARADSLLIGAALAVGLSMPIHQTLREWCVRYSRVVTLMSVSMALIVPVCMMCYPIRDPITYVVSMPLVSVCTAGMIGLGVLMPASPLAHLLSWRVVRHIGLISYGAYLWHWPIVLLLRQAGIEQSGAIGAALGLMLGEASYRWIEAPLMRGQKQKAPSIRALWG
jgi:peptidoglycan/LPS O-acetylase OafA/YrhL